MYTVLFISYTPELGGRRKLSSLGGFSQPWLSWHPGPERPLRWGHPVCHHCPLPLDAFSPYSPHRSEMVRMVVWWDAQVQWTEGPGSWRMETSAHSRRGLSTFWCWARTPDVGLQGVHHCPLDSLRRTSQYLRDYLSLVLASKKYFP